MGDEMEGAMQQAAQPVRQAGDSWASSKRPLIPSLAGRKATSLQTVEANGVFSEYGGTLGG